MSDDRARIQEEFARAASAFDRRTAGRFDDLGVVEFARATGGETVCETGAGTGRFLSLFASVAARLIAVDLTAEMLKVSAEREPAIERVVADGTALPLATGSIDLACAAQMLHHVVEPVPVLLELARVAGARGRVLIVDQVGNERFEALEAMNELETLRDPTHAASRPPSAFRILAHAAGLAIVDERMVERRQRLSEWMWPEEFPADRMDAVRDFIDERGGETGMDFRREGDDYSFTRNRIMVLARRAS